MGTFPGYTPNKHTQIFGVMLGHIWPIARSVVAAFYPLTPGVAGGFQLPGTNRQVAPESGVGIHAMLQALEITRTGRAAVPLRKTLRSDA